MKDWVYNIILVVILTLIIGPFLLVIREQINDRNQSCMDLSPELTEHRLEEVKEFCVGQGIYILVTTECSGIPLITHSCESVPALELQRSIEPLENPPTQ